MVTEKIPFTSWLCLNLTLDWSQIQKICGFISKSIKKMLNCSSPLSVKEGSFACSEM